MFYIGFHYAGIMISILRNSGFLTPEYWLPSAGMVALKVRTDGSKRTGILKLLKNLDAYSDYSYEEAREKFAEYISLHGIKRSDVDLYIRQYPMATFKFYYELGLDHVLA